MPRTWRIASHDEALVRRLCGTLRIAPLTAQVLCARGVRGREDAVRFLDATLMDLEGPEELPGVPEAADRIVNALRAGRRITIYGDYDVDGVSATAILWHCLHRAGATVDYYIPSRLDEGYGLNCDAIRQLHDDDPQRLLISVDCGIASVAEAALARELGLELIVTDHHQFAESLPPADCIVHPRLEEFRRKLAGGEAAADERPPASLLCGAGVALKLAWAVCKRLGDGLKSPPELRQTLANVVSLAAMATVADVVPLTGENRIIVRDGLSRLAKTPFPGLRALLKIAGVDHDNIEADSQVGFQLAPRINAAGRLGQARLAVELLTTDNADRARQLARYVDELNKNRRTVENRILKQAKAIVEEHPHWLDGNALVLARHDWHPGVIGIVASRVAEQFEKPVVLISLTGDQKTGQGSGRTYAGCDLHRSLRECREHLLGFGGHNAAAGLQIDADRIDGFRDAFSTAVGRLHTDDAVDRELHIDAEVRLADVNRRSVKELDRLGPFGQSNARPLFAATRVDLASPPKKMGEGDRHLQIRVRQYGATMRAIAFGRGEWADEMAKVEGPISVCFAAAINRYQGMESVELQLKDWQPANGRG